MFAINHAATALLVKRRFPEVPFWAALLSVQFVELLWVVLNYAGIERTTTEPVVTDVGDIHLVHMPFSHSVATTILFALLVWAALAAAGRHRIGVALAAGLSSHLVLDLATHNGDIAIAPFVHLPELGTFLYSSLPSAAFVLELVYGVVCWRVFRGSKVLLAIIVGFNVANASLFFSSVPGPEAFLANRPTLLVTIILLQIVVTLLAVGVSARKARMPAEATAA